MTTQIKRRRGTSAEHATFTGAEGELTVNTTNESVHVHDGSTAGGFELARADGSNLAMGSDLTFGDNDKAIFGAGSDLQIYHDGFNSWLTDQGQGDMYITTLGNAIYFSKHGTENLMSLNVDGDVKLYYDNSLKLSTTSTGVDVTGTVTADGLAVDGNPIVNNSSPQLFFQTGASHYNWQIAAQENVNHGFEISSGSQDAEAANDTYTKRLVVEQHGDISFYEDTGTTAKFFWDASAESLGIGTTTHYDGSTKLTVAGRINTSNGTVTGSMNYGGGTLLNVGTLTSHPLQLMTNNTTRMYLDTSGNVGIGTSSPSEKLHISNSSNVYAKIERTGQGHVLVAAEAGTNSIYSRSSVGAAYPLLFRTGNTERMRIDSSGNLLVGTTSTNPTTGTSEGIALSSGGLVMASNSSDAALALNRTATNGDISIFKKDGSPVGSIGSEGGDALYIQSGTTSGAGLHFHPTAGNINPARNGAKVDNALDLGRSTHRFKNLYLSGKTSADTYQFAQNSSATGATEAIYRPTTGHIAFKANSSERMRIDSSGNVGIGTSTPAYLLGLYKYQSDDVGIRFQGSNASYYIANNYTQDALTIVRNSTEAMRIDSSSRFLVGTTTGVYNEKFIVRSAGGSYASTFVADSGATAPLVIRNANLASGSRGQIYFIYDATTVGTITSTTTATAYNTSSDYRLKTDVQPMTGATERLKALKPVNFEWISSGERVDGFIAHEAQEVVPEAVTGTKDAVDAEGNPEYQGIDQSKLVPLLVATIQELEARITQLENS